MGEFADTFVQIAGLAGQRVLQVLDPAAADGARDEAGLGIQVARSLCFSVACIIFVECPVYFERISMSLRPIWALVWTPENQ